MAVKIFNLRDVPDNEAEAVRELLNQNEVDYYETPPGNWGISVHALWLNDESDTERVGKLLSDYQEQHYENARREYELLKLEGKSRTFLGMLKENPVRMIIYFLCIALVLYISISPFLMA